MKLIRTIVLPVLCLLGTWQNVYSSPSGENVLWEEDLSEGETASDYKSGWVVSDGHIESNADGLLLNHEPAKTIRLQRLLGFDFTEPNPYRYLQIEVAGDADSNWFFVCANSSRAGGQLGVAGEGLTTFDLAGQKAFDTGTVGKWVFTGFYRSKNGVPLMIKGLRNVAIPIGGLTIDLLADLNGDGQAGVGDALLIRYYAESPGKEGEGIPVEPIFFPANHNLPVQVVEINGESQCTLNDDGKDGDEKAGDGIFSQKISLKEVVPEIQSNSITNEAKSPDPVFGVRTVQGQKSTGVASFGFSFGGTQTTAVETPRVLNESSFSEAASARAAWEALTKGEELARGVAVKFYPAPDYNLTTEANDAYDLTDGTLSSRADDRVWFNKDAVGWRIVQDNEILMLLDLGGVKPVGQIAIRVLGGKEQGSLVLPSSIEFLGSNDGKEFHSLQRLAKLLPAEQDLDDGKTAFYVPEEGRAFMHAFVCQKPVNTRYVAIKCQPYTGLFVDQISVLAASDQNVAALSSFEKVQLSTEGAMVYPRKTPFVVTRNIITPNWFLLRNYTVNKSPKDEISFEVRVPESVEFLPAGEFQIKELSREGGTRTYEVRNLVTKGAGTRYSQLQGPFYFKTAEEGGAENRIEISTKIAGNLSRTIEVPLEVVDIPEVGELPGLDISLGWISDREQQEWPDLFGNWKKLGFNFVSSFPRNLNEKDNPGAINRSLAFLAAGRELGFRVIYEESPFHVMEKDIHRALATGEISEAEQKEIFNQIDGGNGKWINPFYRGKYFWGEIERVARFTRQTQPDHVYLDIEWWHDCIKESKNDPQVRQAFEKSGKTWEEFILTCGDEVLGSLVSAIRQASSRPVTIGLYNSHPDAPPVQAFFEWDRIYPKLVNIAMPSLYVQGRAVDVAKVIRSNYQRLGPKRIIPWLTAGTYGEFDPTLMRPMVLETILNGAGGFTTYWFGDFDPMDYFYMASALAELSRYPSLIRDGAPARYSADNEDLHYTCFKTEDEAFVLVGNYSHSRNSTVRLPSPLDSTGRVITADGLSISAEGRTSEITVPPGTVKLVYFRAS